MSRRWARVTLSAASLAVAAALLGFALPAVVGADWSQIGATLLAVKVPAMLAMLALWAAALWAYTFVLTASLPGLTRGRALTINVAGSAVSNMLPFGGAAGVAVTFAMARSWGHGPRAVAVSTLVTGIWNVLSRLLLPAVGLLALLASGRVPDAALALTAGVSAALLLAIVAGTVAALAWPPAAARAGAVVELVARLLPAPRRPGPGRAAAALQRARGEIVEVLQHSYAQLSAGMVGYLALQALLFAVCLHATGATVGLPAVIAAFAVSRALTLVLVTPNGVGVSETGTAVVLVALGAAPSAAAGSVLLFAVLTHLLEIPAGGVAWTAWVLGIRRRKRSAATGSGTRRI